MSNGTLPNHVQRLCRTRIAEAGDRFKITLPVKFRLGDAREFPLPRNMAYCADQKDHKLIVLAPRLVFEPVPTRLDAVLRHELGHAIEQTLGEEFLTRDAQAKGIFLPSGAERRADALAYFVWGKPIRYDADTVQSLCSGIYPRPVILGV
jgi:hypothetical protein